MVYVVISLLLGLCAWTMPVVNLFKRRSDRKNYCSSIISFSLCLISIYVQILLMKSYGEEWVLIIDAVNALSFVVPILIIVTIVLNILSLIKYDEK